MRFVKGKNGSEGLTPRHYERDSVIKEIWSVAVLVVLGGWPELRVGVGMGVE